MYNFRPGMQTPFGTIHSIVTTIDRVIGNEICIKYHGEGCNLLLTTIYVFCKDKLSFDTFVALGDKKNRGVVYVFVNSAVEFKESGMFSIKILDDFWDNPNREEILR